jgi:hypothetical protein
MTGGAGLAWRRALDARAVHHCLLSEDRHRRGARHATNATSGQAARLPHGETHDIVIMRLCSLAGGPMRHADLHEADPHLPEAFVGALIAFMLLLAAFVSTPASAATAGGTPSACTAVAPLAQ